MKIKILAIAGVVGRGVLAQANADEIQFVTLPEVVRTTVVRESNIPDYSRVTRVIRDNQRIYEVTVRRATDNSTMPDISSLKRRVTKKSTATQKPVQNGSLRFTGKATSSKSITRLNH